MMILQEDSALAAPDPTMASPQWWGADSNRRRARTEEGASVFVKTFTSHAHEYVDIRSSIAVTAALGEAGLGPRLHDSNADSGELVLEDLTESHATSTLSDFPLSGSLDALIGLRRKVWDLEVPWARTASVFDDLRLLALGVEGHDAAVPSDVEWMLRLCWEAEERIAAAGTDRRLIHGDANCSNVAIRKSDGACLLLDCDWAAYADPLQDVGSLLLELAFTELEGQELFEQAWGSFDQKLYSRARLYSAAEALRGGLLGALMDDRDPGTHEYSKFADWMFLRARIALTSYSTDDYMRSVV